MMKKIKKLLFLLFLFFSFNPAYSGDEFVEGHSMKISNNEDLVHELINLEKDTFLNFFIKRCHKEDINVEDLESMIAMLKELKIIKEITVVEKYNDLRKIISEGTILFMEK